MTHFCGHQFDVGRIEIPPSFFGVSEESDDFDLCSSSNNEDKSSVKRSESLAADGAHYFRYKDTVAPCQQCDDGRPKGEVIRGERAERRVSTQPPRGIARVEQV